MLLCINVLISHSIHTTSHNHAPILFLSFLLLVGSSDISIRVLVWLLFFFFGPFAVYQQYFHSIIATSISISPNHNHTIPRQALPSMCTFCLSTNSSKFATHILTYCSIHNTGCSPGLSLSIMYILVYWSRKCCYYPVECSHLGLLSLSFFPTYIIA